MKRPPLIVALWALASLLGAGPVLAQQSGTIAPTTDNTRPAVMGPETLVTQERRGIRPPPLGSDMFSGQAPAATSNPSIDANHLLRPGDKVRVTLWGLVNQDQELTIDPQGNVVVPGVGPVSLNGVTAGAAPRVIETASRRVYSSGVQIYATAVSATTNQVLVTGPVERPGAYAGGSDEALVVYLQRAGGIDAERGSYRRVNIVRNGQVLATADLYEFLRAGILPNVSFRNGDALVVQDQGPSIAVSGDVRSAYSFELLGQSGLGEELMRYARPRPGATHAAIVGVRNGVPYSAYLPLAEFAGATLYDGDRVQFETDVRAADVLIRVEGARDGESVFSLPSGTTVGALLQRVAVSPNAEMESLYLRRDSVRLIQKQLLNESLDRLERTVLTAPARSRNEAAAREASATYISQYIASARQVEPLGILSLNNRDPNTVVLETGDVVVIPRHSQVISIAGEVQAPQSILATEPGTVSQYVGLAGGYASRADRRKVLVFRQDGQIRTGGRVYPGDRILVPSKADSMLIPLLGDLAAITLAIARIY